jgi:iron complex outermembrane receptor protein
MRGTLFSQNTVLVNGLSLNDPQTAHYNFNLPFSASTIDRIEILRGPGSSQYGANAFGGVVNVITKIPEETTASIQIMGGENGLVGGEVTAQYADATLHSMNSVSYKKSDGYHLDTDFLSQAITTSNRINASAGQFSITGGYEKKDYGAFDFYTPGKNLQSREALQTGFADAAFSTQGSMFTLTPSIQYRRNTDQFILTVTSPSFYTNNTATDVLQCQVVAQAKLFDNVTLTGGTSILRDDIISTYEGDHSRNNGALFASAAAALQRWTFDASLRFDANSDYGNVLCPSVSAGYELGTRGNIYATASKAFREPSYTELYINDGFNIGNPGLQPELGWSYEAGGSYRLFPALRLSSAIFQNDEKDLIDYVMYQENDAQYHAVNFESAVLRGAEMSFRWDRPEAAGNEPALRSFLFSYSYLDSHIEHDSVYAAKYSNNYARHQISCTLVGSLPLSLSGSIGIVYKRKAAGDSYTLADASLTEHAGDLALGLRGTNLFNQSYEENPGVPMPGRWMWLVMNYKLF